MRLVPSFLCCCHTSQVDPQPSVAPKRAWEKKDVCKGVSFLDLLKASPSFIKMGGGRPSFLAQQILPNVEYWALRVEAFEALPRSVRSGIRGVAVQLPHTKEYSPGMETFYKALSIIRLESKRHYLERYGFSCPEQWSQIDCAAFLRSVYALVTFLRYLLPPYLDLSFPKTSALIDSTKELMRFFEFLNDYALVKCASKASIKLPDGNTQEQASFVRKYLHRSGALLFDLDCSELNLTALPEEIRLCRNLRTINASGNYIMALPKVLSSFLRLTTLDVRENLLREIPVELSAKVEIHAQDNFLLNQSSSSPLDGEKV